MPVLKQSGSDSSVKFCGGTASDTIPPVGIVEADSTLMKCSPVDNDNWVCQMRAPQVGEAFLATPVSRFPLILRSSNWGDVIEINEGAGTATIQTRILGDHFLAAKVCSGIAMSNEEFLETVKKH